MIVSRLRTSILSRKIKLSNLVPEIAPATVAPDKIAQLKGCLADDSPILGYKFRPGRANSIL